METDAVTCSWVYDLEEYKTTQVLARRIHTPWARLAAFAFIVILGIGGMLTPNALSHINFRDPGVSLPLIVIISITFWVISQVLPIRAFCGAWSFRRDELHNARLNQTISHEGYFSDRGDTQALVKWPGLARGLETTQGFALFLPGKKKSFLWLPMHGFSRPEDIDRCRTLIRENVTDFRTLKS